MKRRTSPPRLWVPRPPQASEFQHLDRLEWAWLAEPIGLRYRNEQEEP